MSANVLNVAFQRPPEISGEEFLNWREDPVTQWVFRACQKAAAQNQAAWLDYSWNGGNTNPLLRTELHTRADAYLAIPDTPYEGWVDMHQGDE